MSKPVFTIRAEDTLRGLTSLQKKQIPFAMAKGLTEIAKISQVAVQNRTREAFKLHSNYIPRGVMVQPAKKAEFSQKGYTTSAVFTSNAITPFMAVHEVGGLKRPRRTSLAIPSKGLQRYSYRTSAGAVKMRWKPRTLLQSNPQGNKGKGKTSRVPFVLSRRGQQPAMIVRRTKKGPNGLEMLYLFSSSARIHPVWRFEETVKRVASKVYRQTLEFELQQALATAKG